MPNDLWGPRQDGTNGILAEADFVAFVASKVGQGAGGWSKNVGKAYQAMVNHAGQAGANMLIAHKGLGVCHVSEGKRTGSDGVTVFFTVLGNKTVDVVGIGEHEGSASYNLLWTTPSWKLPSNKIDLDKLKAAAMSGSANIKK